MPRIQYTSYRLGSRDPIDESAFLQIRNLPKDQFDTFVEEQINQLKNDFWSDRGRLLKFSLGLMVGAAPLMVVPILNIVAALAFCAGFFGLMSFLLSAASHSNLKSDYKKQLKNLRKTARSSESYQDFLAKFGYGLPNR